MRRFTISGKSIPAALVFLLFLGGCSVKKVPPTTFYHISQETPGIEKSADRQAIDSIRVTFSRSSRVSESSSIYYTDKDFRQQPYAYSRWYDTPAAMLEGKLIFALEKSKIAKNVTGSSSAAETKNVLEIGVLDFVHKFERGGGSGGRAVILASLVRNRDGKTLCTKLFEAYSPAATDDAAGGVAALNSASDKIVAEIVEWLGECGSR